ncbi:hypothetical protein LMG22037_04696 [Paraburkholderia phenoliruptrix]|uniref:Uncharacterized protein n=1 Tax=Paraburkholderia phenoliruptrix TaxID=252970 RepID=A0A6J5BWR2_9BURK|nr:hypothetical protein [Paraburkholderia phenoliruptrix]CAB3720181.1 hypothetical protein LMG22037_04696 [Paraburkholderia phenoliruptrix]
MPPRNPNSPLEGEDKSEQPKLETTEELQARIRALEDELSRSNAARVIAEDESARIQAQAQSSLLTTNVTERFAGEEDGKQMWWYRIDLAPCGGTEIRINGTPYYHGSTYKFETDLLRSVKEIVARTWSHENSINGANENPYKQAQNKVLGSGRGIAPWAFQ